jgi:hypothetical protein
MWNRGQVRDYYQSYGLSGLFQSILTDGNWKMGEDYAGFFMEEIQKRKNVVFPEHKDKFNDILFRAIHNCIKILNGSDALYHDTEHTLLVTLCGQDIFVGRKISKNDVTIDDWIHYSISLLFHDIGYARGILKGDNNSDQIVNFDGTCVQVPPNATDAFLTPYHVERSQIFLNEAEWTGDLDIPLICDYIKNTEFPIPKNRTNGTNDTKNRELTNLISSADLIGQLGDPGYYKKIPALFYEFEESGANAKLGYNNPMDLKKSYPSFFYNYVQPHIAKAIEYLSLTHRGRQWNSNLNFHVFFEEHRAILSSQGLELLHLISEKLKTEQNFKASLHFILTQICKFQGWPVGHAYVRSGDISEEVCMKPSLVWHLETSSTVLDTFVSVTEQSIFKNGEGLPGRVLASSQAAWDKRCDYRSQLSESQTSKGYRCKRSICISGY